MKIAFIGIRGIPVIYSGFESFSESLSINLVKKGYDISVYCRSSYVDSKIKIYKGVNLITLPTFKSKNFETFIHSFLSTVHTCIFLRPKIIYYLGVGNTIFTLFPRFFGIKTVVNVDGLDWKREKWGFIAKFYLRLSESIAVVFPNRIITDSQFIKKYYIEKFNKTTTYIPYGFDPTLNREYSLLREKLLKKYNLKRNKYFVWVGRTVPENHIEELVIAFKNVKTDFKCLIISDNFYQSEYGDYIRKIIETDKRIVLTGFLLKNEYAVLTKNSFCYVETKRSGGTHPSLIEAMGLGCLIVSNNSVANKQILKNSAFYYNIRNYVESLAKALEKILSLNQDKKNKGLKLRSKKIVNTEFNFELIAKKYAEFFNNV